MKKLIYTVLAVSIIFTSCKKEEENEEVKKPSIVGVWSPESIEVDMSSKASMGGVVFVDMDTSYTMLPGDEEWEGGDMEYTADGKAITDGDTSSYTYSGNILIMSYEEEGVEMLDTFTCLVSATTLQMSQEEFNEYEEEGMSSSTSVKMTMNAVRK